MFKRHDLSVASQLQQLRKFVGFITQTKQPLAIPLMTIRPADAATQVVHSRTFLVIYKYVHKKNQEQ